MIRHLNSTGRRTIEKGHVTVRFHPQEDGDTQSFDLQYRLDDYEFDRSATVRLEAWRLRSVQRWDLGTVGEPRILAEAERQVTEMTETPQFKLIVVAADGSGRLLGMSNQIRPVLPRQSLLPVTLKELRGEVWRVNFGESESPELEVNRNIDAISELVRSDAEFRSLIMPQVFRTVLSQIIVIDRHDLDDDEGGWWIDWLRYAQHLVPEEVPTLMGEASDSTELDDVEEWIDRVVEEFAEVTVRAASSFAAAKAESR